MADLKLTLSNGKQIEVEKGTLMQEIVKENYEESSLPAVLGRINGKYYELSSELSEEGIFEAVSLNTSMGSNAYSRTLQFILIKAVLDIFPDSKITIEHTISKGLYGEIHMEKALDEEDIKKIKKHMQDIINKDMVINKITIDRKDAIEIFRGYAMMDKVKLLNHVVSDTVKLYELEGRYDYFYGPMAYSTGVIKYFDLMYYEPGFILRYPPEETPTEIPDFVEYRKLSKIFKETEQWLNILDVADVGSLNEKIESGEIVDIIRVSEALHEKKIAYIADMIAERKEVKVVLIAGPSSSGKTTFANRLAIQLRVNGLIPKSISLDDYFVNRDSTPLDEEGKPDFESIDALDLELFNKHLNLLMDRKEVEIPTYNFYTGQREWKGNRLKLPQNGVLVIEGIHGLNDKLTSSVLDVNKFKIYISALTQLNVDNHNRIATTDVRKIRRIVRDTLSRGYKAEVTLTLWPSIRRGEERNIFIYQEQADVMFNSTLVYELCVLKKHAIIELEKINSDSPVYYEALRLKSFLGFFKDLESEMVPENSILREFIGGSWFYKY
ncbi:uridine kinase [Clostridium amylolyticum]|uniref:Uridine kinase n=1 Tax=Clostridium amylolyticum TaxID=1121298 RepID=A0A1M6JFK4_9CLOT|nr:nucleoside kinase [Clostridium amylolyticum]SHJ45425.1 uridine kinase [Clostridium amylolyticum]